MAGPLEGIKILDLSRVLAGPYSTMMLADLGAEVIKLEKPHEGDLTRGTGPFIDGESSYFLSLNRGKKSITLDLSVPKGKELFLKLVKQVDVVVENFVPGTMKKLGLDYEVIRDYHPEIIYAAISGYGQTGPYAQTPALDIIVQAMGGVMSITGEPEGPPVRPGVSYGDIVAGMWACTAILAAIYERSRSGKGQMIDISMLDCQVAVLENAFTRFFATNEVPKPVGTRHPLFTPFQAFQTRDGYMVVGMVGGTSNHWPLYCSAIDRVDLIDDERFQTGWLRTQYYSELEPMLNQAMKRKTTDEWIKELSELGIPCGPINNISQAASDPRIAAREMIVEVMHKRLGKVRLVNTPIKLSRTPGGIEKACPDLGEDTEEVLKDFLQMSTDEVEALRQEGIL